MGFFRETGSFSMMRLTVFICVIAAVTIAIIGMVKGNDLNSLAVLISSFLVPAFSGKSIQSFTEGPSNVEKND